MTESRSILLVGGQEAAAWVYDAFDSGGYAVRFLRDLAQIGAVLPTLSVELLVVIADCQRFSVPDFIRQAHQLKPGLAVLVIAPYADKQHAIECISAGATDYLVAPVEQRTLLLKAEQLAVADQDGLIAHAPSTRQSAQLARRAASSSTSILISGETGTGKEVFARYIHRHSRRADKPFVAVNCAAMPESMIESILFGHEKGAFTGATARRPGKFEQASEGTVFLDEITEMPLEQQAKLLRVLQEKEVERLGGHQPVKVDVRIISATNRDVMERVRQGHFREDLYYRLHVFPLHLRPLRERREDILPLANRFMTQRAEESGQPVPELSQKAADCLMAYDWPGNIRELENVIQRACVLRRGWVIMPEDLMIPTSVVSNDGVAAQPTDSLETASAVDSGSDAPLLAIPGSGRKQREWRHVLEVLLRHDGHRSKSAEELGMTTRMLRYKLAKLRESGIDIDSLITRQALAS